MRPTRTDRLLELLRELLHPTEPASPDLASELQQLESTHGPEVYGEWLHLLAGLRLDPAEAKSHWLGIVAHRTRLEAKLGSTVDPRVALVGYFIDTQPELENSNVVEIYVGKDEHDTRAWDELTGLTSSSSFAETLERDLRKGERANQPTSLLVVDIDDFKTYNDRNGRDAGDSVLVAIARLLTDLLRLADDKTRLAGKEFAATLPHTPKLEAAQVAERLRGAVEERRFPGEDQLPDGTLTVSVGIATFPVDARDAQELIRQAQRAMRAAKSGGKNQVHLCGDDRRSNTRVDVALDGTFGTWATGDHALKTINVSLTGLRFSTSENLPPAALVDIHLAIPGATRIEMAARVVTSEMVKRPAIGWSAGREYVVGGRYEISARIVEISSKDLRILGNHLQTVEDVDSSGG